MSNVVPFASAIPSVIAIFISTAANAQFSGCMQFFPGVTPKVPASAPQRQREICFDAFATLHSGQSHTPVFSVEHLTKAQLTDAMDEVRTNRFYPEARLPFADRAQLEDYKNSGYDRGHMAPAADMPTAQAMAQSFSLANMVPQAPENNRKTWANIEKGTRKFVKRSDAVYIFTGPVFKEPVTKIGANGVWVPSYLYKLVYDPATKKAWAHWVENTDTAKAGKPITYKELVQRTGIEFLPGINAKD